MAKEANRRSHFPSYWRRLVNKVVVDVWECLGPYNPHMYLVGGRANVEHTLGRAGLIGDVVTLDADVLLDTAALPASAYEGMLTRMTSRDYKHRLDSGNKPIEHSLTKRMTLGPGDPATGQVDFVGPEYGGTGRGRRHQRALGLMAQKARGSDLVLRNWIEITVEEELPEGGLFAARVRVAGVGSSFVMKAFAMRGRAKAMKDAADLVALCMAHPGENGALVRDLRELSRGGGLVREALAIVRDYFKSMDDVGPRRVAAFEEAVGTDREVEVRRRAHFAVSEILRILADHGVVPGTDT